MATNYPAGLDTYTAKTDNVDVVSAATINALQDAVAALQAKAGITSSADTNSLDYKVAHAASTPSPQQAHLRGAAAISTCPPQGVAAQALTSGVIYWAFFTAPVSMTTTQIRFPVLTAATSSTANSGWGLYSVDASDNITLLTTSVSTTHFTTGATTTKSWLVSQALVAGNRYAVGVLNVNGSGNPTIAGYTIANVLNTEFNTLPRVSSAAVLSAHATTAVGSLGNGVVIPYAVLI